MKKRILFVIPSLGIGGAEVFCSNLVYEFSKKDEFEVHLIVFFNILSDRFKKQLKDNITIHILNKKKGFSALFLHKLKKEILKINPDIINSHSSHTLRYLLLISRLKKIPIVHTITNDPMIHDKLLYYLFKIRMHQKSWNKLTFVGISNLISDNLSKVYNYPREKIFTIYNGLYKLVPPKDNRIKFDFFNCASLTLVKRQDLLLRALAKTKHNATLAIAGDGVERDNLYKLSKELKIEDRVYFQGTVDDPTPLYFASKCFILTSFSEGNPISINEAMSAGIPIIATKVGGVPDLVDDSINGFLFDVDEKPENIAKLMDKVLELKEESLQIIKKNNQLKVEQWYMDKISDQYLFVFRKLIHCD